MSIKIGHESPISIFEEVQDLTDYDYFLVHLFEERLEYLTKFERSKEKGRVTYLDTSIFELGTAFETSKFADWVQRLEPDYYFMPDVLESYKGTIRSAALWVDKYRHLPGTPVGVVQGRTLEELFNCYSFMDTILDVDMIAISFDYSFYQTYFPHPNKFVSWAMGRVRLLQELDKAGVLNRNKKHHLLGVALPLEGLFYKDMPWITSIDTSNPVVHGIKNISYIPNVGLFSKESQKLFELINIPIQEINLPLVKENIDEFRRIWT